MALLPQQYTGTFEQRVDAVLANLDGMYDGAPPAWEVALELVEDEVQAGVAGQLQAHDHVDEYERTVQALFDRRKG